MNVCLHSASKCAVAAAPWDRRPASGEKARGGYVPYVCVIINPNVNFYPPYDTLFTQDLGHKSETLILPISAYHAKDAARTHSLLRALSPGHSISASRCLT